MLAQSSEVCCRSLVMMMKVTHLALLLVPALLLSCATKNNGLSSRSAGSFPIGLWISVPKVVQSGEPIPMALTITNGLGQPIVWFWAAAYPSKENLNMEIVSLSRDGSLFDSMPAHPSLPMLLRPGRKRIPAYGSLETYYDLSKWVLRGGWAPGEYRIQIKVRELCPALEAPAQMFILELYSEYVDFTIE
jgi:hypothetical protein